MFNFLKKLAVLIQVVYAVVALLVDLFSKPMTKPQP